MVVPMKNPDTERMFGPQEISLQELWRFALRRKWIIALTAAAVVVIGTLYSFLATPKYTATGQLLIDREPNILSFEDIFQIESFNDDYFQTQYKLLQSRALAGETIDRIRANNSAAFQRSGLGDGQAPKGKAQNEASLRGRQINALLGNLVIRPVRKTRLVQASFTHRDPEFAAEALNSLFDAYIEMNVEKKFQATEQATDFLTKQIASVQAEIEQGEKKLQEYGQEKNIVALSSTENTVIEKLGELNKALTDAQIDRVNKETYYNEISVATPDYIPDALANPLIQKLREEYNRLNRDYMSKSVNFLPNHPAMQSLKAELDTAKKALEDETQALIKRAYSDYQAALKKEQALAGVFNRQKNEAFQLNSNAIQYNSLQIQIQNQKNLLESLMKRKSETDVSSRLKGLRTSNISIVDRAEVPQGPSSPNKKKNILFAMLLGLVGGLGLAFLVETLDVSVKGPEDVEKYAAMPMLGMVPDFSVSQGGKGRAKAHEKAGKIQGIKLRRDWTPPASRVSGVAGQRHGELAAAEEESMDLVVHLSPGSPFSEYYRSIRTTLLFSAAETKMQALAVMSPLPQEGKTGTLSNLAGALAQAGKSVVIIDADLRKPRLHKIFHIQNLNGLTKYLTADMQLEDLLRATPIPTLFLINAGPLPLNPVELLGSEKMATLITRLKEAFDFVLVDTPPLLAVSDAIALGPRLDGAILVVRAGKTPREALRQAREKLDAHKIKGVGVIINQVRTRDLNYFYMDKYHEYYGRTGA